MHVVHVRPAELSDVPRIAEIQVRSWQAAYRHILDDEFLDGMSIERRKERWESTFAERKSFVVEYEGDVAGFIGVSSTEDPETGEVQMIYLDPRFYRKGLGESLMGTGEDELRRMGFENAILWVFADNVAARRFYEAMGWKAEPRTALMELGGRQLTEIRYQKALQ